MSTSITSLQETSPDNWAAKYRGNYGIYTIKIKFTNGKLEKFSCTCPSDGYPCKHIPMVTSAIKEKIAKSDSQSFSQVQENLKKIIASVSQKELAEFVLKQSLYNPTLANAILLEFTHSTKTENTESNKYNAIFKKIFDEAEFDEEDRYNYYNDYYDEDEEFDLDELDEWLEKAQSHVEKGNYAEAEDIYRAIIEEYATWASENSGYATDYISSDYQYVPFEMLMRMALNNQLDCDNLFEYCFIESEKSKYPLAYTIERFYDLMAVTAESDENKKKFLDFQHNLLKNESNEKGNGAEQILSRIISFYEQNNQIDEAWKLREDNLQIDDFRKAVVSKYIEENKLTEAKLLISEYLKKNETEFYFRHNWHDLLLTIALKESDTKEIRRITNIFLLRNFDKKYYRIYKSTFSSSEWNHEVEKLISIYQKESRNWFSSKIGNLLVEENDAKRLLDYVTRHCSTKTMENYYKYFVKSYPAETLRLFQLSINDYVKNNVGREHYEYTVKLMKIMQNIAGGIEIVSTMKANFKTLYKNRRAMMEILEKVK